jgi:MFS family permease
MQHQDAVSAPTEERGLPYKWKVLGIVVFGIFMVILDTTVVNVAFQTLRQEFGSNLGEAQWIISVYVLAIGISPPSPVSWPIALASSASISPASPSLSSAR